MNLYEIIIPHLIAAWRIIESYKTNFTITEKEDFSPVTEADISASQYFIDEINKIFPNDIVITEERIWYLDFSKRTWLIDPLDWTKNYIKWENTYSIILSCVENGKTIFWVIYYPATQNYYFAEKWKWAFYFDGISLNKISLSNHQIDLNNINAIYKPSISKFQETINLVQNLSKRIHICELRPSWFVCTEMLSWKYDILILWGGWIYELSAMEILFSEAGGFFGNINWSALEYRNDIIRFNYGCVWLKSISLLDEFITNNY